MATVPAPTLHCLCGKIAAGKSTLAQRLADRPATLLISEDHWMSSLFGDELKTIQDYSRCSARLCSAMTPRVIGILRQGMSVVLDFQANTVRRRSWMRAMIDTSGVAHDLHLLDVSDTLCKARLQARNRSRTHPFHVSDSDFELFTSYFVPPGPEEGFNIIIHRP